MAKFLKVPPDLTPEFLEEVFLCTSQGGVLAMATESFYALGASIFSDKALDRVARLGDAWLADPGSTFQDLQLKVAVYEAALDRHGREKPATLALRRDIYVAESASDAAQVQAAAIQSNYRGIDPEALLIGEVGVITERLLELQGAGFTDVIIRNLHPDQTKALQSTHRLAQVRQAVLSS